MLNVFFVVHLICWNTMNCILITIFNSLYDGLDKLNQAIKRIITDELWFVDEKCISSVFFDEP